MNTSSNKVKNEIKMVFQSLSENISIARITSAAFAAQLDFTLAEIDEIKVAVSEAVSNAIIHGYAERTDCNVELTMHCFERSVEYIIHDDGCGIGDIKAAREPSEFDGVRMGLGFSFMEAFMDTLEIDSSPDKGTTVRLVKKLSLKALQ